MVSTTDAICRIASVQRAFTNETDVIRQRIQLLEAAGEAPGRRLTRRTIRWFWCAVFLASMGAFAAGYLVSLRH